MVGNRRRNNFEWLRHKSKVERREREGEKVSLFERATGRLFFIFVFVFIFSRSRSTPLGNFLLASQCLFNVFSKIIIVNSFFPKSCHLSIGHINGRLLHLTFNIVSFFISLQPTTQIKKRVLLVSYSISLTIYYWACPLNKKEVSKLKFINFNIWHKEK